MINLPNPPITPEEKQAALIVIVLALHPGMTEAEIYGATPLGKAARKLIFESAIRLADHTDDPAWLDIAYDFDPTVRQPDLPPCVWVIDR